MSDKADQPQTVQLPPEPQPDTAAVAAAVAVVPQNYQDVPPPVYEAGNEGYFDDDLPPSYQIAASLPSYEEAEATKEGKPFDSTEIPIDDDLLDDDRRSHPNHFALIAFPSLSDSLVDSDQALLGNDFVFFFAFLTAFLFNWIGFLLLMCFCHTIAARYGALSGFGLSLAKWTLIVKNSTELASTDNAWLWWLIMAFGMLICMRAIFQYLAIKKTWRSLSTSARERLFFFY